jgi:hypothetical protein
MTAYKFLTKDGIGPISGYRWPMPVGHANGAWVETLGPLALCERGIHLCSAFDLAHWLHDDLWEVESDGEHIEGIDCIIVRRARLVRRIDAWSNGGAARFAEACIEHSTSLAGSASSTAVRGWLEDAKMFADVGYIATSAYSAALAASRVGAVTDTEAAYRRERRWQAAWIADEVIAR